MHPGAAPERPRSLLLAGGGLANSLIAYRLASRRPELEVRLVEAGPALGGRHTWSFFESDLPEAAWLDAFVVRRWPSYEVRFPRRRRRLRTGYRSITSDRLDAVVRPALGSRAMTDLKIAAVGRDGVTLADGRRLTADVVIDGRGQGEMPDLVLGYQKFVGLTLRLAEPHGLLGPVIMDATVEQLDGYRFVYVLPWDERTVLVEDTRYSDGVGLDPSALRGAILDYAAREGWTVEAVLGEETGVLPLALEGDIEAHWRRAAGGPRSGLRAALFHPTTGYSLPDAVALADALCALEDFSPTSVERLIRERSLRLWRERAVFRLVNRMLFRAALPGQRYRVLERFYGLPEPLIRRFYAARLTGFDIVRLLTGKPPVPFWAGVACIGEKAAA